MASLSLSQLLDKAARWDQSYPIHKHLFHVPTLGSLGCPVAASEASSDCIYFCGNSLGLMPRKTRDAINNELDAWSLRAVDAHFNHPRSDGVNWMDIDLTLPDLLTSLLGTTANETAVMNTLTSNLNALLCAFYKPETNGKKNKILFEKGAFPSDYYAFLNQVRLHNLPGNPEDYLLQIAPKKNEFHLNTSDIVDLITQKHDEIALICFPGIQYYTGQFFDIQNITKVAHDYDIKIGWDLAHCVGNVSLDLHQWDVDFACFCSYKYLNSGPGSIAGIYVNEKYSKVNQNNDKNQPNTDYLPRLAGWWGNDASKRFQMIEKFEPISGALGFRQSNPSVIDVVSLKTSLEIFNQIGFHNLVEKSKLQSSFLLNLLRDSQHYIDPSFFKSSKAHLDEIDYPSFTILTPFDPDQRGCQLSLLFFPLNSKNNIMKSVFNYLWNHGIICDERRPNVIRFAPTPLYNTFTEIVQVVEKFNQAFDHIPKN
ncbi:kynureninase [Ascoidea rubescens DSM 1968]|uniref:Kynureninase n=1 Tax=Ascoidea rubescens DSM 1968 TaxID=1344418 RepID=A0A1D2VL91_9ASCO|nr:kynureninase [Ascoidea rubescens DSM 1968]ODV62354.1 kynureninase [Ascoidea rubescens DSM 1968]